MAILSVNDDLRLKDAKTIKKNALVVFVLLIVKNAFINIAKIVTDCYGSKN